MARIKTTDMYYGLKMSRQPCNCIGLARDLLQRRTGIQQADQGHLICELPRGTNRNRNSGKGRLRHVAMTG